MARIPPVDPAAASPEVRAVLERAQHELPLFRNQVATLAHLPGLVGRFVDLYAAFPRESLLQRRLVELAILTVSALNACQYCILHHTVVGAQFGLTSQQLEGFRTGRWRDLAFDETERLVVEYAEQVTRDANAVTDDLFARLRGRFTDAEIVELTIRTALCGFFNRLNQALRIDVEPDALAAFGALPTVPDRA